MAAGNGADHGDALRATLPRDTLNLRAASAKPSSVSTSSATRQGYPHAPSPN
jgi:hypothetical protein